MPDLQQLLKGNVRMLILSVLAEGPSHGYEIARQVQRKSEGALRFGEGTLYPTLHQMEKEGLLQGRWEEQAAGPARKYYRLTAPGRRALQCQARQWREFASAINTVLEGSGA
jgi:PadR family transcriptional regulator PadR